MEMQSCSIKQKIESKIFNGYVIEPIPIFVIVVSVGLVFFSLAIWATCDILWPPQTTEVSTVECFLTSFHRDGPIYMLETDDYVFDLPVDSIGDEYLLEHMIHNQTLVVVKYESLHNKKAGSFDTLEITASDGSVLISQESISLARIENSYRSLILIWMACLFFSVIALGGNYILSNAPRYPRLASMLVRAPYRNF